MKCRKRGDEIMVNIRHSICQSIPRRWGRDTILSLLNFNLLSYTRSSAIYYYSRLSAIIFLLFLAAFAYSSLLHSLLTSIDGISPLKNEYPITCWLGNATGICPANYYPGKFDKKNLDLVSTSPAECPEYFRWIHEDLRPWRETGITEEMVERASRMADFRLVILNGKAYVESYRKSFQTRDVFTVWGILQLLRLYPGRVPDLDLVFQCADWPVISASLYSASNATAPPPLFHYCANDSTLDIVFPDWTFWGWPEINIKPWDSLLKDLDEANSRTSWMDRDPYAYWKGNPLVSLSRIDLLKCNVSDKQDWNARVYLQDWSREAQQGYKHSNLASQCTHRYKIYIEGWTWSVSEKYILACDSVTLLVKPHFYDFYSRGLMPMHHYWPIRDDDKCRSIKFAVDWGNSHQQKARAMGKEASNFIQRDLKMDKVYDYMFHLLSQYAKLLKYKPVVPRRAVEICSETMACRSSGLTKEFMMESLVKGPKDKNPCVLQPPYDPAVLQSALWTKQKSIREVERWEKQYWDNQNRND
ncbi:uncharacterized protein LOC108213484 [Daucus carota subsp. sativus]|nr:PREDICTED: O-glucosyltransferase rumi homolog [Daucus carota subsp. sativus]